MSSTAPTKIYYAWVTTWNTTAGTGTDPQVYISHELVELITDPDANSSASGWVTSTFCPGATPCELSDNCEVTTGVGNYTSLTGVNCWSSSYYSNAGGGCVIPGIVSATSSANTTFTWGGGKLLQNAQICLIFAGSGTSAWTFTNTSTPTAGTADDIKRGVQTLLTNTQYYNLITQYGVNKPTFNYAAINSTTTIPNPFQEAHIQQVVKDSINAGAVPNPASNTVPIIYMVVVNNSGSSGPKYTSATQIGNHGTFQFTPAPPTNVPTANPPAGTTTSLQGDQWGITEIYPSRASGGSTAWFLPSNPNSDTRHVVDSTTFTAQADGSYRNTQTNVIYNIAQSNGFTEASLVLNQGTLATQYFMQDNKDWTNVEMTLFVRLNTIVSSTHSGPPNIMLAMRGAQELNSTTLLGSTGLPKSCEAADYRVYIEPVSGIVKLQKDLQYTSGITPVASNPSATSPLVGLSAWQNNGVTGFVGLKAICYNLSDGKSVAIEFWMDTNGANNWVQVLRYVDSGNWSAVANGCTGAVNQQINWGGPIAKFIWNNISSIDIKYASIREIDVYALNPQLLTPPAVTTPTTPPTSSPPNNLPQNPPPPNQAPPTTAATGTLDKFGVREIYPSLSGGQSWYLSSRGLKGDSRVIGIPNSVREYVNGDGSFHLSTNSAVTFFVTTLAGYSYQGCGGSILSHLLARVRQYMFSTRDWKNVEVTTFHRIEMVNKTGKTWDIGLKCRTGSHSRQGDCQGSAYEIQTLCFPGSEIFKHRKEQWHDSHATDRTASFSFSSVIQRWVGEKFVAYNIVDSSTGHVTGVRLEHYWNDNGDGVTWTKVNNTTDTGGWGFLDALCNGDIDEKIIWGGPLIGFFWNDFTRVDYKWLSIREIDTSQQVTPPGGPPSTSPPSGPPPQPPKTSPLIGPNAYNVLKLPYNVIVDDSGGCDSGIDPNAHIGETQIGTTVPGTGGTINMAAAGSAAIIAGQKILNTSSLMYNKVFAELQVSMKITGLPLDSATKLITGTIRRGVDGLIVSTLGSISPANLTSQYQLFSFKTPSLPNYTLNNGDVVCVEYSGGDLSNFVTVQTDNTSGFDGANGAAVDVINGSGGPPPTFTNLTGSDLAGSFWHTGQTGIAGTITEFYNISGATWGNVAWMGAGFNKAVAEGPVNGSSALIGKTIYEIDVWLTTLSNATPGSITGTISVYLMDINTGTKYTFGTLDASTIPTAATIGVGVGTLFAFFNYSNTHVNTVNTYAVVEFDATAGNVGVVAKLLSSGTAYDGLNTEAYVSGDGSTFTLYAPQGASPPLGMDLALQMWNSSSPPPGTLPAGTGGNTAAVSISGGPLQNYLFLGGLLRYGYTMAALLANDSQSKLIGLVVKEVDVDLGQIGTPASHAGTVTVFIFNSAGQVVGYSTPVDASTLVSSGPAFATVRFLITLYNPSYALQVGDRIAVYFEARETQDTNLALLSGVGAHVNVANPFDGNHTVAAAFGLDGTPSTYGKWLGLGGSWVVYTSWDIAMTIYT